MLLTIIRASWYFWYKWNYDDEIPLSAHQKRLVISKLWLWFLTRGACAYTWNNLMKFSMHLPAAQSSANCLEKSRHPSAFQWHATVLHSWYKTVGMAKGNYSHKPYEILVAVVQPSKRNFKTHVEKILLLGNSQNQCSNRPPTSIFLSLFNSLPECTSSGGLLN